MTAPSRGWRDRVPADFTARVAAFCAKELAPNWQRWDAQAGVDRELWYAAADAGLLGVGVPAEYGGGGGDFGGHAVVVEQQASVGDTAWGYTAHAVVAQHVLTSGTRGQRVELLPRLVAGEVVGALAISEPGAGSDLQAIRSTVTEDDGGYLLNGSKTFVTNGGHAELVLVFARSGAGSGFSLVLVPATAAGFSRGAALAKVGRGGQDTCELFFDGVRLPAGAVLGGQPGQGLRQLLPLVSAERLLLAVGSVAAMDTAVRETLAYARGRSVFGRKLNRYQNTQFELASCATEVALCRAFVDQCVDRQIAGELGIAEAAMAKLAATERLCTVLDRCVQLFGGNGYLTEFPIARAWLDARAGRIYGGTSEILKEIIAGTLR